MKDRKRLQKIEQEASGKLIKENHNGNFYSIPFLNRAISYYLSLMCMRIYLMDPKKYIIFFQKSCRAQLQSLLLHWDIKKKGKTWEYEFFKSLLEDYYDNRGSEIFRLTYDKFKSFDLV